MAGAVAAPKTVRGFNVWCELTEGAEGLQDSFLENIPRGKGANLWSTRTPS